RWYCAGCGRECSQQRSVCGLTPMPPYKVRVTKAIWSNEDRTELFDDLYRDIALPFVPFVGLALQQDGWRSADIYGRKPWRRGKRRQDSRRDARLRYEILELVEPQEGALSKAHQPA